MAVGRGSDRWVMGAEETAELGPEALVPAVILVAICLAIIAANVVIIATIVSMSGEASREVRVAP